MTAEEAEEAILRLPPEELAKFRAWFADFEAGRVKEPEATASRLGRLAGRAFADIRKRIREP
jgi:predicted transcriptional regulator